MTRFILSGLLCLSFVAAQGHVLSARAMDAQARLRTKSDLTHHDSAPRPDHYGGNATRALWKHLSFHWQAQPKQSASAFAQAPTDRNRSALTAAVIGERSTGALILRV